MPDDGAPFRYSFSALKDRHNAVEVNWIDPKRLGDGDRACENAGHCPLRS
ncbi:host specificity J domain protein [Escherichia coli P0304816.5]|nr:host specificity J domain protein [Escherichia coli P0304816.15]ENH42368.1 host specificity J domain protein [Escherichia coli P0304816.5]